MAGPPLPWWLGRHVYAVWGVTGLLAVGGLMLEYGDAERGLTLVLVAGALILPAAVWWYLSNAWIERHSGGPGARQPRG